MKCHAYHFIVSSLLILGTLPALSANPRVNIETYSQVLRQYQVDGVLADKLARAGLISADSAARKAQSRYGGKVLSVRLVRPDEGTPFYRVKLLLNGNVRVVQIEANE